MRKICILLVAVIFLFSACKKKEPVSEVPASTEIQPAAVTAEPEQEESVFAINPAEPVIIESEKTLSDISLSLGMRPDNYITVKSGGSLTASGIALDKVDDATAEAHRTDTGNAMILIEDGGSLKLSGSMITGSAPCSHAICVNGSNASLEMTESGLSVTEDGSNALCVLGGHFSVASADLISAAKNGSSVFVRQGSGSCSDTLLSTCDTDGSYAVTLEKSSLDCSRCTLKGDIRFLSEGNELLLSNSTAKGNITSEDNLSDLTIRLTEGSTLTAGFEDSSFGTSIVLGKNCSLVLLSDAYIDALEIENENLKQISSNGFSIYYNSEHEGNAWLQSKSYHLEGGGSLAPII